MCASLGGKDWTGVWKLLDSLSLTCVQTVLEIKPYKGVVILASHLVIRLVCTTAQ